MKETIAIVGLPASGKTVLWSVLASNYRNIIHPVGEAAWNFVEEEWKCLQHGKWQDGTKPEKMTPRKLMGWTLGFDGKLYDVLNCDVAGEDFEKFIQDSHPELLEKGSGVARIPEKFDSVLKEFRGTLSPQGLESLKELECQFARASAICLLLDLSDDLNKGENFRQERFVSGVLHYLRSIKNDKCAVCFVVTKYKLLGESQENLRTLVDKYYRPIAKSLGMTPDCLIVDAVADTVTDPQNGNLLPKPNFHSEGLDELLQWMYHSVRNRVRINSFRKWTLAIILFFLLAALCCFVPFGFLIAILLVTPCYKLINSEVFHLRENK